MHRPPGVAAALAACAIVAAVSGACRDRQGNRSTRRLAAVVSTLPRCVLPPPGDTTGWWHPQGSPFLLPKGFERSPGDTARKWADGRRTIQVLEGEWGTTSFGADSTKLSCQHAAPKGSAFVMFTRSPRGPQTVDVWPVDTSDAVTPRYHATGEGVEDRALLLRILQTLPAMR